MSLPQGRQYLNRYLIDPGCIAHIRRVAALRFYLVTWLGERVVADPAFGVYGESCAWDPLFYETTRVGESVVALTTDTTLVQAISGVNLSIILRSSLAGRRADHARSPARHSWASCWC